MNNSFLEDEIFGDLVYEEDSSRVSSIILEVLQIASEIVNFILCLSSSAASVFLIYIIVKFKNVREKTSIFLLHYATSSLTDLFLMPIITMVANEGFGKLENWKIMCTFYTITDSTNILVVVFGTAIGVFWFIEIFKTAWIERIPHFKLFFIVSCYLFCFIKIIVDTVECFVDFSMHTSHSLVAIYCILLVVNIIINIYIRRYAIISQSQQRTQYLLLVSTYIMTSYTPLLVTQFCFYNYFYDSGAFLLIILYLCEIYALSGPIVVVYLLGHKNKYFKAAYNRAFKKAVRNYDEEDMDSDSNDHEEPTRLPEDQGNNDAAYAIVI